jgi:hypothetical protein
MCKIKFGDPNLHSVRLSRKYELDGIAFIKGFEKPIGFTFYSPSRGNLDLTMEALEQAENLYIFFKQRFKVPFAPMRKDSSSRLNVELELKTEDKEEVLQEIEKNMSVEWRKVFNTILSVHEA